MGPTASGKTKLSIAIAKHFGGEVINGDSVAIYKELNIGSAKITHDEMQGIKHHLLSVANLDEGFSVFDFQKETRACIEQIKYPIIVGGSGLYIKSALYDYRFEQMDPKDLPSLDHMISYIKENDPLLELDWKNERRVVSAYKNIVSGVKPSENQFKNQPLYDIYLIYLNLDKENLKKRLEIRLDQMLSDGFIEETRNLIDYPLNIIGYRELKGFLNNEVSLEEAKTKIIQVTMKFAKRQKTWFLNQMQPHMYDALSSTLIEDVITDLTHFLEG